MILITGFLLAGCTSNAPPPSSAPTASLGAGPSTLPSPAASQAPIDLSSLTGRIAFSAGAQGAVAVYVVNADGSDLTRLTAGPGDDFQPSWSPDRRLIAYRSEPGGNPELWVMNADGTGQHRLAADGGFPDWSPDGSMIAYAPGGGPSGRSCIAIMNADGSGPRCLPGTDYGETPSWSPDGKRIAFTSAHSGLRHIYVVGVDDSQVVDLATAGEAHMPAWSPDGVSILFASSRDRSDNFRDIFEMRPDGSDVRRLTRGGETPAWSPDGRYIVFAALGGLAVMRPDGSGVTPLPIQRVGDPVFPDWR
jgi:TolB protein